MKNEILTVCDQLAAATANGVYQGIIIAILVALGLRFLGRTNAATRHAVWFCTMLSLVALILAHCLVGSPPVTPRRVTSEPIATLPNFDSDLPSTVAAVPSETTSPTRILPPVPTDFRADLPTGSEEQSKPERASLPSSLTQAQPNHAGNLVQLELPDGSEPSNAESDGEGLPSNLSSGTTGIRTLMERLLNPVSVRLALGSKFPRAASAMLLALWLIIAGFRVFALLLQLARIQGLKHQSLPPSAGLSKLFRNLAARLDANRKVDLRVSPTHRSSFLLGFLHPVILLPAEERMEPAEAELVLRHELAHVQRRDDWVNLIQHFLLAVFFFHPAFWWISRQLSLEREIACDDHVLQQSGRPQAYALVLANLAARMQKRLPLLAPGSSNNKTQLKERIDMILNKQRNASPRLAKTWLAFITSTVVLATAAVICSAPRIVLAQIETTAAAANEPLAGVPPVASVNDVAPGAPVSGEPQPDSADIAPPTPPRPAAIDRGPKFKPGNFNVDVRPNVIVAPTPPAPPTPALAAIGPVSEPPAPRAPRPVRAPRPENSESSLEQRLDRLERMVNSLLNQQNPKGRADLQLKLENEGMIDRKEMAEIEALAKQQAELAQKINPQEIEKIKEQAERDARRAVEQAMRATAKVGKAQKANQKQAEKKFKADSQAQLEALQKQVEALERQREKLDQEIERLEQDQEELNEQDEDSDDSHAHLSEPKAECVTISSSTR